MHHQRSREAGRNNILIGVAGCLAMILAVFLLFHKMVNRPLSRLLDLAGSLRRGDLSRSIEVVGRNEISHMSARMNIAAENLRGMIGEIAAASKEQAIGVEQINKAVAEMDKATQDFAATAEELAASAGQFKVESTPVSENQPPPEPTGKRTRPGAAARSRKLQSKNSLVLPSL
mgnify:CR=1 FL=1